MKRIDVVHRGDGWVGRTGNRTVVRGDTKEETVQAAAAAAAAKASRDPVSVKIHKRNGDFQEERTYPRSADPRRSKG